MRAPQILAITHFQGMGVCSIYGVAKHVDGPAWSATDQAQLTFATLLNCPTSLELTAIGSSRGSSSRGQGGHSVWPTRKPVRNQCSAFHSILLKIPGRCSGADPTRQGHEDPGSQTIKRMLNSLQPSSLKSRLHTLCQSHSNPRQPDIAIPKHDELTFPRGI